MHAFLLSLLAAGASAIPSAKLPMERNQLKTREVPTSFPQADFPHSP